MKTSTDRHATKPSRWGKTPRRGMRRIAVTLLVALLPVACASHEAPRNGAPATPGQSQAGNYLAGRHAQAEREIGAAVRFLNAALEKDPDNTELLRRTFMLMAIDGHFDKAVALAKRLDGEKNKSSIAAMVLVIADIRDQRFDAAD